MTIMEWWDYLEPFCDKKIPLRFTFSDGMTFEAIPKFIYCGEDVIMVAHMLKDYPQYNAFKGEKRVFPLEEDMQVEPLVNKGDNGE